MEMIVNYCVVDLLSTLLQSKIRFTILFSIQNWSLLLKTELDAVGWNPIIHGG